MVTEMAMSAVIQKHANHKTPTTNIVSSNITNSIVRPIVLPSPTEQQQHPIVTHGSNAGGVQGYITVNNSQAAMSTLPILTSNLAGQTQVLQTIPEMGGQGGVMHLAPLQYASTLDGAQLMQSGLLGLVLFNHDTFG